MSRHNISIKGLVYCSSHDCYFDIDREVSTADCRSSSGDSVDLLSQTICTTLVVSDWCITNLAHGWWVSIQSIVGQVFSEEETDLSAVRCGSDRLLCCLIVGIHASGISISLSLWMLLGWSAIWIASLNSTRVPVLWIETHQPWARFVSHQSLTTTVVQIVWFSKSTLSPDEDLQCAVETSRSISVTIVRQTIH